LGQLALEWREAPHGANGTGMSFDFASKSGDPQVDGGVECLAIRGELQ
jgi:hypothetical protein